MSHLSDFLPIRALLQVRYRFLRFLDVRDLISLSAVVSDFRLFDIFRIKMYISVNIMGIGSRIEWLHSAIWINSLNPHPLFQRFYILGTNIYLQRQRRQEIDGYCHSAEQEAESYLSRSVNTTRTDIIFQLKRILPPKMRASDTYIGVLFYSCNCFTVMRTYFDSHPPSARASFLPPTRCDNCDNESQLYGMARCELSDDNVDLVSVARDCSSDRENNTLTVWRNSVDDVLERLPTDCLFQGPLNGNQFNQVSSVYAVCAFARNGKFCAEPATFHHRGPQHQRRCENCVNLIGEEQELLAQIRPVLVNWITVEHYYSLMTQYPTFYFCCYSPDNGLLCGNLTSNFTQLLHHRRCGRCFGKTGAEQKILQDNKHFHP